MSFSVCECFNGELDDNRKLSNVLQLPVFSVMSCSERTRLCGKCNRSLFVAPVEHISQRRLYEQYSEFLCLLQEEERYNLIVSIYDVEHPCRHYFHLLCLCLHRAYFLNILSAPAWTKVPCPAIECAAKYSNWSTLNFIPYKQFYVQYAQQNPSWSWLSEFQS